MWWVCRTTSRGQRNFATGDNVNDLTPNVGDPNSWIPEYKAFLVNLEPAA